MMPPGRLIHVVDDDRGFLKGIERLLTARGLEVRTFSSAERFQAEADLEAAACLILDIHLTGMSGIELLSRLSRAGPRTPRRPHDGQRQRRDPASGYGGGLRCVPSEAVSIEPIDEGNRRGPRAGPPILQVTVRGYSNLLAAGAVHLDNRD